MRGTGQKVCGEWWVSYYSVKLILKAEQNEDDEWFYFTLHATYYSQT